MRATVLGRWARKSCAERHAGQCLYLGVLQLLEDNTGMCRVTILSTGAKDTSTKGKTKRPKKKNVNVTKSTRLNAPGPGTTGCEQLVDSVVSFRGRRRSDKVAAPLGNGVKLSHLQDTT